MNHEKLGGSGICFESIIILFCQIHRHLAEEIRGEYSERMDKGETVEDLVNLAKEIIPYNMQHNAETEACDLLMEIECLDLLEQYVDKRSFQRVCLYLTRSVSFLSS